MLEDYRDVDIDELMAGLTEEELKDFFITIFVTKKTDFKKYLI